VHYYPPKAETTVTVTETIACNSNQELVFVLSASPNTVYSGDYSQKPHDFSFKKVDGGSLSDSSLTFNLTEDGRLKSINATTTGEGEAVVKSAVTLATAIAGAVAGQTTPKSPCDVIKAFGGDKPVSLTFTKVLAAKDFVAGSSEIEPSPGDLALYSQLKDHLPALKLYVTGPSKLAHGADLDGDIGDALPLTLNETAVVTLAVKATLSAKDTDVWSQDVIVPQSGQFVLPIPRAALFGKQSFNLTLSDAGAITTLTYGKDSGAAGALNAGNSITGAAGPASASDQAAQIKSQADLIAQQQRLARCKANPTGCT
jgi:hypothetical protein